MEESGLSSHHVGPRDSTQVVRRGSKHLCPLSHLAGPYLSLLLAQPLQKRKVKMEAAGHLL